MTFLQLCKALRREASVSGDGPATTLNQQGEMQRLIEWIQTAHNSVQTMYLDWFFLWQNGEQSVTTRLIPPVLGCNVWDTDRFMLDGTAIGVVEYADYTQPSVMTSGKPSYLVLLPNNELAFDCAPDQAYTLSYDYWLKPRVFVNDTDTSLIPDEYIRVLIGHALVSYGNYESAPEMITQGQQMYDEYLSKLLKSQHKQVDYLTASPDLVMVCE